MKEAEKVIFCGPGRDRTSDQSEIAYIPIRHIVGRFLSRGLMIHSFSHIKGAW